MPRRRPPASGEMLSLAMATRMRLRARRVTWMDLAASDSPSARRAGDGGAAATVGAATAPLGVSVWRVTMDIGRSESVVRLRVSKESIPQGLKPPILGEPERAKAKALAYLEAQQLKARGYSPTP